MYRVTLALVSQLSEAVMRWAVVLSLLFTVSCQPAGLRFAVSFPEERSSTALDGRLLLAISTNDAEEPRFQIKNGQDT